jgi:hypothetical protein
MCGRNNPLKRLTFFCLKKIGSNVKDLDLFYQLTLNFIYLFINIMLIYVNIGENIQKIYFIYVILCQFPKKNLRTNQGYTDLLILDTDPGGIVVIFAKKQEKNWKRKLFSKEIIKKKGKNLGVAQKYEIN